jgi:hypothetical protein
MRNRSTPCWGSCPLQPEGQGQLQLSMWRSLERLQSIQTRSSNGYGGGCASIIGNRGRDQERGGATSSSWGIVLSEVYCASRSRKGLWRMSQNSLVRFALKNAYMKEQGVPELRDIWIRLYYGNEPKSTGKSKLVT